MKRKVWLTLLAVGICLAGCSKSNPVAPSTVPEQGKICFALDAAGGVSANIARGTVTITKGALAQSQAVIMAQAAGSVAFSNLQVGTWTIAVRLFDQDSVEIYTGSGSAVVQKNQTTTVHIRVSHNTGNLVIVVDLPADSGGGEERIVFTMYDLNGSWDSARAVMMNLDGTGTQALTHGECYYPREFDTYPGAQHVIFTCGPMLDTLARINLDGTGYETLYQGASDPRYSKDGRRIVFSQNGFICILDAGGFRQLPGVGTWDSSAVWAPDGRIAFSSQPSSYSNRGYSLNIMNADGSDRQAVLDASYDACLEDVGSDGTCLFNSCKDALHSDLYLRRPDGGVLRLTSTDGDDHAARFNADNTKIVFQSGRISPGNFLRDIYMMNADGSNQTRLTPAPSQAGGGPIFTALPLGGVNSPTFKP